MPLQKRGVKNKKRQDEIYSKYTDLHLDIAMDTIKNLKSKWSDVQKRLASEW